MTSINCVYSMGNTEPKVLHKFNSRESRRIPEIAVCVHRIEMRSLVFGVHLSHLA